MNEQWWPASRQANRNGGFLKNGTQVPLFDCFWMQRMSVVAAIYLHYKPYEIMKIRVQSLFGTCLAWSALSVQLFFGF